MLPNSSGKGAPFLWLLPFLMGILAAIVFLVWVIYTSD